MILKQVGSLGAALLVSTLPAFAHGADRGKATVAIEGKSVSIDYGRPLLKGRDMLAKAEVGKSWRLGADAPTTLATDCNLSFGTVQVPKGSYTLAATKTSDTAWTLNITRPGKDAGAQPEKVGDVPLEVVSLPESVEQLTIDAKAEGTSGAFTISWGKTALKASFSAK